MVDFVARCASVAALGALVIIGTLKGVIDDEYAVQYIMCGLLVMIYLNMGRSGRVGGDGK